jgi:hypothetical protein
MKGTQRSERPYGPAPHGPHTCFMRPRCPQLARPPNAAWTCWEYEPEKPSSSTGPAGRWGSSPFSWPLPAAPRSSAPQAKPIRNMSGRWAPSRCFTVRGLVDQVRASSRQVDAVFDVAGKGALPDSIVLREGTDRIITISDPAARDLGVTFSAGTPKDRSAGDLAGLAELSARGDLTTTVAGTYPLERAADAQRVSQAGHVRGKLVLTP